MTQEITIEVSDLHAEMYEEVEQTAASEQVRQQFENLTHQLYQQVQQAQAQQDLQIEGPEDRE